MVTYSAEAKGIPKKAISTSGQWVTGDIPDLSSLYQATGGKNTANGYAGLDSGVKVPNSLLPTAVVRTNQTNTFGAFAQLFKALYFEIVDGTDPTKIVAFDNSGMTTGKTLTMKPLSTTTQTIQIPNISTTDTLATLGLTQTFTGNPVTIDTLKLGANDADANVKKITNLGVPTVSTDAARADKLGIIGSIPTTACATNQILIYDSTSGAWSCGLKGRTLLASTTLASTATSITVSFTQGDYSKIEYEIFVPSISGGTSIVGMRFNGDSGANYAWSKLVAATATTGVSATSCSLETTASSIDRYFHGYEFNTPATVFPGVRWEGEAVAATVATAPLMVQGTCVYGVAGQITSVTFFVTGAGRNLDPGTYVNVYGS